MLQLSADPKHNNAHLTRHSKSGLMPKSHIQYWLILSGTLKLNKVMVKSDRSFSWQPVQRAGYKLNLFTVVESTECSYTGQSYRDDLLQALQSGNYQHQAGLLMKAGSPTIVTKYRSYKIHITLMGWEKVPNSHYFSYVIGRWDWVPAKK